MALLDTIKTNLANAAQPMQVGAASDQSAGIAALSQAKTGRAAMASAAPRATNLQEQIASGQAALGAKQLSDQNKLAAEQLTQQAQAEQAQTKLQERELDESQLQVADNYANQASSILSQFERDNRTLDFNKDRARLEQLGIVTRLSNDQYIHQLEQQGTRDRLDNEVAFNEALQQAIWRDQSDLLRNDLGFKEALNGKQNQWNEYLSQIDLDSILENYEEEAKAAKNQMIWNAATSIAGAGAGAYSQQQQGSFDSDFNNMNNDRELAGENRMSYGAYTQTKGVPNGAG